MGWQTCTPERLKSFLGMMIAMGVKRMPSLRDYWSSNILLGCPEIVSNWPYQQFRALLSNLHFNDNSTAVPRGEPGFDKCHKIRPILEKVAKNCLTKYHPNRELSIDEAMVGFKGRSSLKQYLPMKPTKRGFKVWCICESTSGYMLNFNVYCGKGDGHPELGLGEKVVVQLSQHYLDGGYCLFFDNYFSSVKLAEELLKRNTYMCATTRPNRKEFPPDLSKSNLNVGEHVSVLLKDDTVQAAVWRDKKNVSFINTFYDFASTVSVKRKQKDGSILNVDCLPCVKGYNKFMGGVDLADQKRKTLSCSRKSSKWYFRLFWFAVDICIVNAFILEQLSPHHPKRTQKEFRIELAAALINLHSARKRKGRPRISNIPLRLTERHFGMNCKSRRRCVVCGQRGSKQKRVNYECPNCDVGLCPGECFMIYHTMDKF